jgi:hypothetical protein
MPPKKKKQQEELNILSVESVETSVIENANMAAFPSGL